METIYACSILSAPPLSKASALHKTRYGVVSLAMVKTREPISIIFPLGVVVLLSSLLTLD
jgi:hypothetical protein